MRRVDLKKWVWARYAALPKSLRKTPVFVAVSGGMDSSVLAAVSLELRDRLPGLFWLHVNYHLRVPDSDREETALRSWAKQEQVPFQVRRLYPRTKPANLQAWARSQRLDFFRHETERQLPGPGLLWMAHHQSDQAETVLHRLLRGSGLKGLGGMSELDEVEGLWIFRPFLGVPQAALKVYADSHRLVFHHDRSNDGLDYLRNRIRHKLLPSLAEENPRILELLSDFAQRSRKAAEALEALASQWLKRYSGAKLPSRSLSIVLLRKQPPALQVSILETWLTTLAGPGQALGKILPALLTALESSKKSHSLPLKGGWRVTISPQKLRLSRKPSILP